MANQTNSTDNQDLDLGQLSGKIRGYVSKANDSFFDGILFIKRNIIILTVLVLVGVGLGIYKDQTSNRFENKIFVIPNFGSVDYLYEEIDHITSKISNEDPVFMKQLGLKSPDKFINIEIEPVVEIYEFIEDKEADEDDRKFQLFKLISENGEMKKILEDQTTSRHYKNHLITITTKGETDRSEIVDPLLNYFNNAPYFLKMKEEYLNNLNLKIAANDSIIKQIDVILNDFSVSKLNSNAMYYNDNTQVSEVIKLKDKLLKEQGKNRIDKVNFTSVIKEGGMMFNVTGKSFTAHKMKFIIPILLVILFVFVVKFRQYYKKQMDKRKDVAVGQ
jgi:hypothetical protein